MATIEEMVDTKKHRPSKASSFMIEDILSNQAKLSAALNEQSNLANANAFSTNLASLNAAMHRARRVPLLPPSAQLAQSLGVQAGLNPFGIFPYTMNPLWRMHLDHRVRKCRRSRTVFTEGQLLRLEREFDSKKYLSTSDRVGLASELGLTQLQVKTWYQNRRMKWKKQNRVNLSPGEENEDDFSEEEFDEAYSSSSDPTSDRTPGSNGMKQSKIPKSTEILKIET